MMVWKRWTPFRIWPFLVSMLDFWGVLGIGFFFADETHGNFAWYFYYYYPTENKHGT